MEATFKAAAIPVPPDFAYKKSYSLAPKTYGKDFPTGAQSLGILKLGLFIRVRLNVMILRLWPRWVENQIYVSKVLCSEQDRDGYRVNQKGGATISVQKRGGWLSSFQLACKLAGWCPASCKYILRRSGREFHAGATASCQGDS